MATPPPPSGAVAAFMRITGASEFVAIQKLEEYGGNLNEAVNAHFLSVSPHHNIPGVNNQNPVRSRGIMPYFNAARRFRPSLLLDPNYRRELRDLYNGSSGTSFTSHALPPHTSQPGEVSEVLGRIISTFEPPYQLGMSSTNADMTGNISSHHRGVSGTDDYWNDYSLAQSGTSRIPDDDIEEEMVQAAIEASKRDRGESSSWQHFDALNGSSDDGLPESRFQQEDNDLAHALSLSIKTAEEEKAIREHQVIEEKEGFGLHDLLAEGEKINNRRSRLELGTSSHQNVAQGVAQPVMGHQLNHSADDHLQGNEDVFLADKWGGMSSEELNEALLLETALYGEKNVDPNMQLLGQQKDADNLASSQADKLKDLDSLQKAESNSSKEESHTKMLERKGLEKMLEKKEVRLPEEPPLDDDKEITIVVRMPDGRRCERRFLKTDKLQLLFDFIDIDGTVKPGTYRVVKSYPRRAYSVNDSSLTLNEVGLSNKNEALFLEMI